jgi:hypothetical protein
MMPNNGNYLIVAYGMAAAILVAYAGWLLTAGKAGARKPEQQEQHSGNDKS